MSTQLLFEGASIEELLARVRDEHGPGVRIVAADKVRSGGFAGFFAREHYSILVEVDAAPVPTETAPTRPVDAPGTLLELADAIDAAEAAESQVILSTAAARPAATGTLTRPLGAAGPTTAATLSTDSPDFAAVLAEWATTSDAAPAVPAAAVRAPVVPAPVVPASLVPAPVRVAQPPVAPFVPTTAPAVEWTTVVASPRRDTHVGRRLTELGVPHEIVDAVAWQTEGDLRDLLVRAISDRLRPPPALRLGAGDVMVIAGPGVAAYELAGTIAKRLRLEPNRVLLAAASSLGTGVHASRRLAGPADAARRSAALHRSDVATIVAVDAPCDVEAALWAGDIADELGARTMWALVDATTKPGDLYDHFNGLGRLDGFAVRSTAATRDPASLLRPAIDLGLPTVWLDGRAGDAKAWASLLVERVSD